MLKILLKNLMKDRDDHEIKDNDLKEIAKRTVGFTGAYLLHLINKAIIIALREGVNIVKKEHLDEALEKIRPSALREITILKVDKNTDNGLRRYVEDNILKKSDIRDDIFERRKVVFLIRSNEKAEKFAKYIAAHEGIYLVECNASKFLSKWLGETEYMIRYTFERILKLESCVILLKNVDVIAYEGNTNLWGAIAELLDIIDRIKREESKKIWLVMSTNTSIEMISKAIRNAAYTIN